jgi:hypothetical protein
MSACGFHLWDLHLLGGEEEADPLGSLVLLPPPPLLLPAAAAGVDPPAVFEEGDGALSPLESGSRRRKVVGVTSQDLFPDHMPDLLREGIEGVREVIHRRRLTTSWCWIRVLYQVH